MNKIKRKDLDKYKQNFGSLLIGIVSAISNAYMADVAKGGIHDLAYAHF